MEQGQQRAVNTVPLMGMFQANVAEAHAPHVAAKAGCLTVSLALTFTSQPSAVVLAPKPRSENLKCVCTESLNAAFASCWQPPAFLASSISLSILATCTWQQPAYNFVCEYRSWQLHSTLTLWPA